MLGILKLYLDSDDERTLKRLCLQVQGENGQNYWKKFDELVGPFLDEMKSKYKVPDVPNVQRRPGVAGDYALIWAW